MFERLFPRHAPKKPELPEPDAQLALGALLVRVAFADRSYSASEVGVIDDILSQIYDLGPIDAAKLRATCEALERDAPGTPDFAEILRDEIDYEHRKDVANAMWQVVYADGRKKQIEEAVLHQIEAALGITPGDSAALQARWDC
ncbi:MAG: TerB family tellurite resistance protein [Paracoccaceae bacterium]